jgi:fatty-acyl-CoA synthase
MNATLFDFLQQRADIAPYRPAVEDLPSGLKLSYGEMNERTGRTAALLLRWGVQPGDRLALLCRNRIEFFELLFACARLQAILVPLNWRMPIQELSGLVEDCGARLLLYGEEDAGNGRLLAGPELSAYNLDQAGPEGFAALRDQQAAHAGERQWQSGQPWYLLYTSGTTGRPKAVIQTFGTALANYVNISQAMGLRSDDTTLCFLPLFHSGGINITALPALMIGARVLFTPGFDVDQTVELIAQGRLDTFFAVPAVYQAISLHPQFDELDFTRVRCWGCGAAAIADELLHRFHARGALILNGMGMTETGPTVFLMDAANARRKIGSVGKPQLLSSVRLVGTDGQEVARGEAGELWFSGPGITPGYYGRPDATAAAKPDGVWLRSGDLGRQDEDGYYYIVGRIKDMYISGGENVYAAEVENQLASHPAILEAAVVGIADAQWGETGCAYLLARPGHVLPQLPDLREFLRQRLAAYKLPSRLVEVQEFPRTAAGKIQKHLLPPLQP